MQAPRTHATSPQGDIANWIGDLPLARTNSSYSRPARGHVRPIVVPERYEPTILVMPTILRERPRVVNA